MSHWLRGDAPPAAGTAAVYTLTKTSSPVGNVKLRGNQSTATLNAATFDATALQTAIDAVWGAGKGVVAGTGPWTITQQEKSGTRNLTMTGASALTGGTLALALTTPGVAATGAGIAEKGCTFQDRSTGILYANTGTQSSPVWTKVGLQT